jgi:hypothetical protein
MPGQTIAVPTRQRELPSTSLGQYAGQNDAVALNRSTFNAKPFDSQN